MKIDDIRKLDKDDLLELLGLQRKPTPGSRIAETLGTLGLGLLLGAGVALVLASKPSREVRDGIRDRLRPRQGGDDAASPGVRQDA